MHSNRLVMQQLLLLRLNSQAWQLTSAARCSSSHSSQLLQQQRERKRSTHVQRSMRSQTVRLLLLLLHVAPELLLPARWGVLLLGLHQLMFLLKELVACP
jgi:hypothetical protein